MKNSRNYVIDAMVARYYCASDRYSDMPSYAVTIVKTSLVATMHFILVYDAYGLLQV
jgi:hypothetical protein